jgi:hypothetical protein
MNVKDFPNYVLVFGGRPDSAIYVQVGTFHITIIKWTFRTIFNFGRRRGASKDARQQVCRGVSKEPAPTSSRSEDRQLFVSFVVFSKEQRGGPSKRLHQPTTSIRRNRSQESDDGRGKPPGPREKTWGTRLKRGQALQVMCYPRPATKAVIVEASRDAQLSLSSFMIRAALKDDAASRGCEIRDMIPEDELRQYVLSCNSLDSTLRTALASFYISDTEGIRDFECNELSPVNAQDPAAKRGSFAPIIASQDLTLHSSCRMSAVR